MSRPSEWLRPFAVLALSSFLFVTACDTTDSGSTYEPDPIEEEEEEVIPEPDRLIRTFVHERHAFGGDHSQRKEDTFNFDVHPAEVEKIEMYVRLRCPAEVGCNAWDMYANVRIWHEESERWLEIGRYITPYGVDNHQRGDRGFVIDVTDFKSMLTGRVTLQSFIEVWGSDGWLVSIDFGVFEGTPDYEYYAIENVLDYGLWSLAGVPYGEDHDFELERTISVPESAELITMRTTITGWGHATPADPGTGRRCAEWCFRTHDVVIDGEPMFEHDMGPIGCSSNPVQPQGGNWAPDRAGWCPGQEVPVRTDTLAQSFAGQTFTYRYDFEPWVNDFQTTADNPRAYYAITSYILVKSNDPIDTPIVQ